MNDFLRHLFPRVTLARNLRFSYTFCLGGLAFSAFLLLIFSGLLLLFYYQPTPERAYQSILFLESAVWGGRLVRSLHYLSGHAMLILILLHTLRVILTGAYHRPRQLNWVIGVLLLFLTVFAGYTGYLLPMDQLAYWATRTGTELLSALPFGAGLKKLLAPDGVGQPLSLLRFYALHIAVIPLSILALSALHFYRIRRNRGLLPYL